MASNERITEQLVRDQFRAQGYFDDADRVRVEEQRSAIAAVARLLKGASKAGGPGLGAPEFIVTAPETPDFVVVVECKASPRAHESAGRDRAADFAVDGVLHYARALSREYNVVAIGASGQTKAELKVSIFLWTKGADAPRSLTNRHGRGVKRIVPLADFIEAGEFDPAVEKARSADLMAFSKELHDFMRDHAKLTESEKPLLVSGTLLALRDRPFSLGYGDYTPAALQKQWLRVVQDELDKADIPRSKKQDMSQPYSTIAVHPELGKATAQFPKGILYELIRMLAKRVMPFISVYHDYDVVGQFYGEFLRYTGGDKKGLGIVLTPRHVTALFSLLANVGKADRVIDPCAGTGGFLISAMNQMMAAAVTEAERDTIRKENLIGIEQQPNMYALAASNMILRGDGKANLYQGSCFDPAIIKDAKDHKPTIGLVNPPYSQRDAASHELIFVKNMLDMLTPGGTGVAIVPISCATGTSVHKHTLLSEHTLEAVMSMPDELFYPVGVITCAMVFTAGVPHAESGKKTWFGFWKDDGFVKTKHLGRVDLQDTWPRIRDQWVEEFRNREVHPGRSVNHYVDSSDEWCAEAYLETDYSQLTEPDFVKFLRDYTVFQLLQENDSGV